MLIRHPDERQLSLYAGGDLSLLNRWLVARHVAKCRGCQATVAAHARGREELLAQSPVPEPDFHALAHRIRVEAAHATGAASGDHGWRWAVAGAVAVAVAIALVLPVGGPESTDPPRAAGDTFPPPAQAALLQEGMEVQLTPEGAFSVRSFHPGSGVLTVTDYYTP